MPGLSGQTRGVLLLLLAMFVLSCMDVCNKWLAPQYSALQAVWFRYAVFLAFGLWFCRTQGLARALRSRRPGLQVLRSLMAVTQNSLVIASLAHVPLADVMAIMQASPLIATLLAAPLLGERVGLARWLSVAVGFSGVLLILRPGLGVLDPWAFAALAASALFAGYQLLTRQVAAHDTWQTTFLMTALPAWLLASAPLPFVWRMPADALAWAAFLAAGACASIGHYLMIKALQQSEASALQPFNYTVLLWAVLFGLLLFAEWPDLATVAGALLIVAGGLLAFRPARRPL